MGLYGETVTGFTLGFWRKNVRLNTKDTKNTKERKKKKETNVVARRALFPKPALSEAEGSNLLINWGLLTALVYGASVVGLTPSSQRHIK